MPNHTNKTIQLDLPGMAGPPRVPPTELLEHTQGPAERLLTYKTTAEALGVPYFKVQRAAATGRFPTYRVFNGRRLLRLSEVLAVIGTTREGGDR